MQIQISHRGTELTEDLENRIGALAADIDARATDLHMAKFVVEQRETLCSAGVVLSWGEKQETVVRHAEGSDWDRVFTDLGRRLERALEQLSGDSS